MSHERIQHILLATNAPEKLRADYASLICQISTIGFMKYVDGDACADRALADAILMRVGFSSLACYLGIQKHFEGCEFVSGEYIRAIWTFLHPALFNRNALHATLGGNLMYVLNGTVYVVDRRLLLPVAEPWPVRRRELFSVGQVETTDHVHLTMDMTVAGDGETDDGGSIDSVEDDSLSVTTAEGALEFLRKKRAPEPLWLQLAYIVALVEYITDLQANPPTDGIVRKLSRALLMLVGRRSVVVYHEICNFLRTIEDNVPGAEAMSTFLHGYLCSGNAQHARIGNTHMKISEREVILTCSELVV